MVLGDQEGPRFESGRPDHLHPATHRRRTIYLDAVTGTAQTIVEHRVHALSIDNGNERRGWPVDVSSVSFRGVRLDPVTQNQRGALTIMGGVWPPTTGREARQS